MNEKEKQQLKEMREHLGNLHYKWQKDPNFDGHCKSNEGYIGILYRLPNWFEAESNKEKYVSTEPELSMIEVYSYLFGPSRLHSFYSVEEAHKEVMSWEY